MTLRNAGVIILCILMSFSEIHAADDITFEKIAFFKRMITLLRE